MRLWSKIKINKQIAMMLVGVFTFITLLFFLLDILTTKDVLSFKGIAIEIANSVPYIIFISLVNYKLVYYFNYSKWLTKHQGVRVTLEIFYLILLSSSLVAIANALHFNIGEELEEYLLSQEFIISAVAAILINTFIVTILEFYFQIKKNEALLRENLEMQYIQLKGQINPHFLFNGLNNLISLINKDSDQAIEYTKRLSEVYRYVLTHDEKKLIHLHEELEFISSYFEILKIRHGDNLSYQVDIPKADLTKFIPPMSLQLLVENAVKHNAITSSKPLLISISSVQGSLSVKNNINSRTSIEKSTSKGLEMLRKKYQLVTENKLNIIKEEKFFIVKLPLI